MENSIPNIDVQTALEQQNNGVVLLDVREKDEFEAGHAENAISIPLSELKERVNELDQSQKMNIICKSGGRSGQAVAALNQLGFNTKNVAGGSMAWFENGLPFISENGTEPEVI